MHRQPVQEQSDILFMFGDSSSALKRLQPILRQEAPFPPPQAKAFWYDLMRSWNVFSNSRQLVISAATSRALLDLKSELVVELGNALEELGGLREGLWHLLASTSNGSRCC